jgi:hypothetical protein
LNLRFVPLFVTLICVAPAAVAQVDPGDVILSVESGNIRTNRLGPLAARIPERVFVSSLGDSSPNFTDEPGFDSEPGTFPVPSRVGFTIERALRIWRGGNFDTLSPIRLDIDYGPLLVSTPTSDSLTPAFDIDVASNGEWHRHFGFSLQTPANDGLYLLELTIHSTAPAIAASPPFWIVFSQNAPAAELDRALRWTRWHRTGECVADFDDGGATGLRDGGVGIEDLLYYLDLYRDGDALADVDSGASDGSLDGGVGIEDLLYYLLRFSAGC